MASKREQILEYLRSTLLPTITEANGYNAPLATIQRGFKGPDVLMDSMFPAVFITTSHEKRQLLNQFQFLGTVQVILIGYVKNSAPSPTNDRTGVQMDLDRLIEDVTKCLETDLTQGGLVKGTKITDIATDEDDQEPVGGAIINAEFVYVSETKTP